MSFPKPEIEHYVERAAVDSGPSGCEELLFFSPVFNVAVPFIDRHLAEGRAEKAAILTAERRVTYGELAEWVVRCGRGLRDQGLGPGERLLMIVRDEPEFFYLFWGAIRAGIVPVPVNTLLRSPDYQFLLEDSEAKALVYSSALAAEIEPALAAASHRPSLVLPLDDDSFSSFFDHRALDLEPFPSAPTDDAFWLYSSGSTGRPKGVIHAHRSLVVTSQLYGIETLGIRSDDIFFSAAKLFFAYGLGNAMSFPLWVGGTAVLQPDRPTPDNTFEIIESFRPTLYFGVPTLYAAMLRTLESTSPDLSSLRSCVSAGEALPADLFNRFKERTGLEILDDHATLVVEPG